MGHQEPPSRGPAEPQLSVVIACRDAEELLDVQLAALSRQRCPVPWEVLICDNGSTDGTVALAESWADRLPLRVVAAADVLGAGPARNAGVEVAKGSWIGFCDADDEVAEGWLEALCRALAEHEFVAGRFEGQRLNSPRALRSRQLDQQVGLQCSSPVVGLLHAGAGNLGIHRSVFRALGGFDPRVRHLQDTDLCWRVQLAGHRLVFVPDLVVHVRLRSTLRGMYRQGYAYGASQARLERRYAGAAQRLLAGAARPVTVGGTPAADTPDVPSVGPSDLPSDRPSVALSVAPADRRSVASSVAPAAVETPASDGPEHDHDHVPGARLRAVAGTVRGAARLAAFFVRNRSSPGAQAWQLGWHLGYRS